MKTPMEQWLQFLNYSYTESDLQQAQQFFSRQNGELYKQFEALSWEADPQAQEQAVQYLAENMLPCEHVFLVFADSCSVERCDGRMQCYRHNTNKRLWENAAKTIVKIGFPKTEHILVPLFMWLLDPNWPGSEQIFAFLTTLPKDILKSKTEEMLCHPEAYNPREYKDLKDQIQELWDAINETPQ